MEEYIYFDEIEYEEDTDYGYDDDVGEPVYEYDDPNTELMFPKIKQLIDMEELEKRIDEKSFWDFSSGREKRWDFFIEKLNFFLYQSMFKEEAYRKLRINNEKQPLTIDSEGDSVFFKKVTKKVSFTFFLILKKIGFFDLDFPGGLDNGLKFFVNSYSDSQDSRFLEFDMGIVFSIDYPDPYIHRQSISINNGFTIVFKTKRVHYNFFPKNWDLPYHCGLHIFSDKITRIQHGNKRINIYSKNCEILDGCKQKISDDLDEMNKKIWR